MERRHSWIIHHSNVAYENPWIQVVEHQVTRPDGEPGIYGVIDAGNNAATVGVDDDGNILLLSEFVFPLNQVMMQIPSGQFRAPESPLNAAQRELLEETGVTAGRWTDLGTFALSGGISTQVGHLFLAQDLNYGEHQLEGTEQLTWTKVPLHEAVKMCLDGTIQDSVSLVGILKAYLRIQPSLHDSKDAL